MADSRGQGAPYCVVQARRAPRPARGTPGERPPSRARHRGNAARCCRCAGLRLPAARTAAHPPKFRCCLRSAAQERPAARRDAAACARATLKHLRRGLTAARESAQPGPHARRWAGAMRLPGCGTPPQRAPAPSAAQQCCRSGAAAAAAARLLRTPLRRGLARAAARRRGLSARAALLSIALLRHSTHACMQPPARRGRCFAGAGCTRTGPARRATSGRACARPGACGCAGNNWQHALDASAPSREIDRRVSPVSWAKTSRASPSAARLDRQRRRPAPPGGPA